MKTVTPELTSKDWVKMGQKLFGPNRYLWQFRCPKCGGTQSARDFVNMEVYGVGPQAAFLFCRNSFPQAPKNLPLNQIGCSFKSLDASDDQVVIVTNDRGKRLRLFPFAEK